MTDKADLVHKTYCGWCFDSYKKFEPAYACIEVNGGMAGYDTVCRNCLCALISHEIENLRTCPSDEYDGKEWLVPFEKEVIYKIALEGLN